MKITLEFDSQEELDAYIQIQAHKGIVITGDEEELEIPKTFESEHVETYRKGAKKRFSSWELALIKANYQHKSIKWIARQLRRDPRSLYNKLTAMYKAGLPRKRSKHGEIHEDY